MAAAFHGYEIPTVGVTPQTAVAAPGTSNWAEVIALNVWNRDTTPRTIIAKKVGGTVTPLELGRVAVGAGLNGLIPFGATVIEGTAESITVESDATAATTEPVVDVAVFTGP